MSLEVRPLNEGLKVIARDVLNEVESDIEKEITILKEWIKTQPHLKARLDDQYLLAFLRRCKHSMEKTKLRIDYFYTINTHFPEMTKNNIMNEKFQEFARAGTYIWPPLPSDSDQPALCILRFQDFNYDLFKLMDILAYRLMAMDYLLNEVDNLAVSGKIEIIDLTNISLSLYRQLDLKVIKKMQAFGEKAMPLRYKKIHILNAKKEYASVINLVKNLLVEKIRSRFYIHNSLEDLHKHVPKSILPAEYGGTNGNVKDIAAENFKQMMKYSDYFIENSKFKVDERLRPNNVVMNDKTLFGLEGSFKKLDID